MEVGSKIGLLCFKFDRQPEDKEFYVYKIKVKNPNWGDFKDLNNLTYRMEQENKENYRLPFVYCLKDEKSILSFKELKKVLPVTEDYEIQSDGKRIFPVEEYLDLYAKCVEYSIYYKAKKHKEYFVKKNSISIEKLNDDNIIVNRVIEFSCEILNGEVYIMPKVTSDILLGKTIYDMMKEGKTIQGLKVRCWWNHGKKNEIVKIMDKTISEPIIDTDTISLLEYWERKAPWCIKNIDKDAKCILLDDGNYYPPQSLKQVIKLEDIKKTNGDISKKISSMIKLTMKERVDFVIKVFKNIELDIIESPITAKELGYEILSIKEFPNLLIKNNEKIKFKKKCEMFDKGCYSLPTKKVKIGILNYCVKQADGRNIIKEVNKALKKIGFPMSYSKEFLYEEGDRISYKEKVEEMSKEGIDLALVVTPSYNSEDYPYDSQYDPAYDSFKKYFAHKKIPSQMVCARLDKSIDYRVKNVVLGIIAKSGGKPWILEENMDDIDCFVGIDIQTQEKGIHRPAVVSCFDGQINDIGYFLKDLVQAGEKINKNNLKDIFDELLYMYKEENGGLPKHIMIHRDGFWNEDIEFSRYFEEKGIEIDIVEIRKGIGERILDLNNDKYNPGLGTCLVKDEEAIIVTTEANLGGAPRPFKIVRRYGKSPMENIVNQIYILSEVGIGAMRKSRLPITIHYADKMCKNYEYVPKNKTLKVPYFL